VYSSKKECSVLSLIDNEEASSAFKTPVLKLFFPVKIDALVGEQTV
jgi:hypothetical protein